MHSSIILCTSVHHGNTRAVAKVIAAKLGAKVVDPDEVAVESTERPAVIAIGSGIYYGCFHRSLRNWVASLPLDAGPGRKIFVYSTSGLPFLACLYHWPLKRALQRRGYQVIGEFSCRGFDTFGPLWLVGGLNRRHPNDRDLQRAESFAIQMAQILRTALEPQEQLPLALSTHLVG